MNQPAHYASWQCADAAHPWAIWCGGLTSRSAGTRWILKFTTRNPDSPAAEQLAQREGVHGVRESELPKLYWRTLERAYEFLVNEGRTPLPERDLPVQIYVFAVDDSSLGCGDACMVELLFCRRSKGRSSFQIGFVLALPSRSGEPIWESEVGQALAATVHELSHCLNAQVLPYRRLNTKGRERRKSRKLVQWIESWLWLDEGLAVAAEASFSEREQSLRKSGDSDTVPVSNDWLRFALDWVDRPECSLDDPDHVYQAAFFVRYVTRLMGGPKFLNDVWKMSEDAWEISRSPFAALAQAFGQLARPRVFCSASEPDVFASGYCFDSYFLNDEESTAFEPEVFNRFKERAVTRTWRMRDPTEWPNGKNERYLLRGLACRYFRFLPADTSQTLRVCIRPAPEKRPESIRQLKAEIALASPITRGATSATDGGYFCSRDKTGVALRYTASGDAELFCEVPEFSRQLCHHAVLIVTHCNFSSSSPAQVPPSGYVHSIDFCIEARLL